ncbi:MAG: hypothetical protein ACO1Q7_02130 [Gemmatimonas sp.]
MVRAKFRVTSKTEQLSGTETLVSVKAAPVTANLGPDHENSKFWKYTPSGEVVLGTINAAAAAYFEIGKEYYVDFIKAE